MKGVFLLTLFVVAGCAQRPTLEELEDEALGTGDWEAVERREEVEKKRLEASGPGCVGNFKKVCIEEQSGIECYCLPTGANRSSAEH